MANSPPDAYERSGKRYCHLVLCGSVGGFYQAIHAYSTRKAAEEACEFINREYESDRRWVYVDSVVVGD